jgi:6,7-dimethyl-8-ribityllumazine synthase
MISKSCLIKNDSSDIDLSNESIENLFKNAYQFPLPGSADVSLPSREKAAGATIGNLVKCGVLLSGETDHYRQVLDSYDYNTLLEVLVHSHELREETQKEDNDDK